MKKFIANEILLLIEGEIYIVSQEPIKHNDNWVYICKHTGKVGGEITHNTIPDGMQWFDKLHDKDCYYKVLASTKQLPNVNKLPVFVKELDRDEIIEKLCNEYNDIKTKEPVDTLLLPKQITTNDELEIIEIIWT